MSEIIFLSDVRLSFPHLVEPQKQKNELTGAERISWNADFIMHESHPSYRQFMARCLLLAQNEWKDQASLVMRMIDGDKRSRCYGPGEEVIKKATMLPWDGYVGMKHIGAGRDSQPQIIQADGSPIDPTNTMAYQQLTRKMYGGCRVNAAVKPWVQDNKFGRALRCDLVAVQFLRDDTPLGEASADASGLFGAVAAGAPASVPSFMAAQAPAMPAAPFGAPTGLPSFMG